MAGAIELASGSNESARAYLSKALQAAPGSIIARRLLASVYLKSGEAQKALEVLQPLLAQAAPDGVAMGLAGEAHLQLGELDKASAMFALAAKANPNNTNNLTALARTRFLKGDAAGAVADLEQIAAGDKGAVADLELVNTQLRRRDFSGALKAIDGLERKQPGKAMSSQLRGVAYMGLKDHGGVNAAEGRIGIFLSTAHPAKFGEVVEPIIGHPIDVPPALAEVMAQPRHVVKISASFDAVRRTLDA